MAPARQPPPGPLGLQASTASQAPCGVTWGLKHTPGGSGRGGLSSGPEGSSSNGKWARTEHKEGPGATLRGAFLPPTGFPHNVEGKTKTLKPDERSQLFHEQVLSKKLIFSTKGKARLNLMIQTFNTYPRETETISSHKLKTPLSTRFPESRGFTGPTPRGGPCLLARPSGRRANNTGSL